MTTTHFNTKDRILGAAEELFAQFGFAGTSLRQVTSRADVNIAAVNYHFGSKENLVNEVFRRRMDEMSERRLNELHQAQEEHPGELEPILAAFIQPALALTLDRHGSSWREPTPRRTIACGSSFPTITARFCGTSPRRSRRVCRNWARKNCIGAWILSPAP
jgi:AcrR family transcriptional regulator